MKGFIIVLIFINIACNPNSSVKKDDKIAKVNLSQSNIEGGIDICKMLDNSTDSLANFTINNSKELLKSINNNVENENCGLNLMDSLAQIKSNNQKQFIALDSLVKNSDGFVSEYLSEISVLLLNNYFQFFISYLIKNESSYLYNALVNGVSLTISVNELNKDSYFAKLRKLARAKEEITFLDKLSSEVDPEKFD